MKKFRFFPAKAFILTALALCLVMQAKAQMTDNGYAHIDWQYNFAPGNGFANHPSGWGMNFEGGYYLTEHIALGAFLNYHSNHRYYARQTIATADGGSLTTDRQHTVFQVPFGATARYSWNRGGALQPYAGMKLGLQHVKLKSAFSTFSATDNSWGFYFSPEVGISFYPWAYGPGLHVAAYYSHATNKGDLTACSVDGMNNFGMRVGISF